MSERNKKTYIKIGLCIVLCIFFVVIMIVLNKKTANDSNIQLQLHFNGNASAERVATILDSIDGEVIKEPKDAGAYVIELHSDSLTDAKQLVVKLDDLWEVSDTKLVLPKNED